MLRRLILIAWLCFIMIQAPKWIKVDTKTPDEIKNATGGVVEATKAYASGIVYPVIPDNPKDYAKSKLGDEYPVFEELIQNESGWKVGNINKKSGACGLGQAFPCSKYTGELGNYKQEVDWAISYINNRYGTPTKALTFWKTHKNKYGHWY